MITVGKKTQVLCSYCNGVFSNYEYSGHILTIATGQRTLETCLEAYADFIHANVRSEWKNAYQSMYPSSIGKIFNK